MPFDTGAIANFILDLAESEGVQVTPMKLQKLLYYAHGWHLALTGEPLLNEQVEAWKWGPVIRTVWNHFKPYGDKPIGSGRYARSIGLVPKDGKFVEMVRAPTIEECDGDTTTAKAITKKVWETYRKFSGVQLSSMTHQPDSPWDKAWKESGGRLGTDISDHLISEHFGRLAKQEHGAA